MNRTRTIRGCDLLEVASAMQKAIRRGDARLAGYWAIEIFESAYHGYASRRSMTISAGDCWGFSRRKSGRYSSLAFGSPYL